MVKLIKDAFGIVKQFTSIFSSTECVCNCLPKLNHAKHLEHAFFTWENCTNLEGTIFQQVPLLSGGVLHLTSRKCISSR